VALQTLTLQLVLHFKESRNVDAPRSPLIEPSAAILLLYVSRAQSSGILDTRKHNVSEIGSVLRPQVGREKIPTLLGPLNVLCPLDIK
jgi:hypothetical protein